tara:strand:+ start:1019 stop:2530 length:1512 start_codon:yes stop_codon:yes gene_type:complete
MNSKRNKKRVLVFMLAYNAEKTICETMKRLPQGNNIYDLEALIVDDASKDKTFRIANEFKKKSNLKIKTTILRNPINQGFGGNVKIGFMYAIKHKFDFIALTHGDGQYPPEEIPHQLKPLLRNKCDAVFGSRMMEGFKSLKGGMPIYKFIGNKVTTFIENFLIGTSLSEFHTGQRLFSVNILKKIPFKLNSNDYHFDTQIIIQLSLLKARVIEMPIKTHYGDEVCHVNGWKYCWNVCKEALLIKLQKTGIIYKRRYDTNKSFYQEYHSFKPFGFMRIHQIALENVKGGSKIIEFGSGTGIVSKMLKKKKCKVLGLDKNPPKLKCLDNFLKIDLDENLNTLKKINFNKYDYVFLLDLINHLKNPEKFMEDIKSFFSTYSTPEIIVTTPNVGFIFNRIQLLFGFFNYGRRGILHPNHTRLFTFKSFKSLLEESGYEIIDTKATPAPFDLAFGKNIFSSILILINKILILFSKNLFGYSILIRAKTSPNLNALLKFAEKGFKKNKK